MTRFGPPTAIEIRPYGSLTRLLLLTVAAELVAWVVWVVVL